MENLRVTRHLKRTELALAAPSLLLAVLTGCSGSGAPASPVQPAPLSGLSSPVNTRNSAVPNNCQKGIYIVPRSATIHLNQVQLLSAYQHFPWQGLCYTGPIKAYWSASGGTLKVINSGKQADFSASKTGSYTITARVLRLGAATAYITVVK
jgi:hypothetical protein